MRNNDYTARKFNAETDYFAVSTWWRGHGWPEIPLELLSSHGMIVDDLCAAWLYKTDSKIAWIEWLVGNPKATSTNVFRGMVALFDALKAEVLRRGDEAIFTAVKHRGLVKFYTNLGFQESDVGMTHLVLKC